MGGMAGPRARIVIRDLTDGRTVAKLAGEEAVLLDPPYPPAVHALACDRTEHRAPAWCDDGDRGKIVGRELCTGPALDSEAKGRRAVAITTWPLEEPADLQLVVDSNGHHVIARPFAGPVTFRRELAPDAAYISITFVAAEDTTIQAILLLAATSARPESSAACTPKTPAPPGTCRQNYYTTAYTPLWAWQTAASLRAHHTYATNIKLYT